MTAINMIVHPKAVYILTDGAGYKPDGEILTIQQKVIALSPLNTVLAARGVVALLHAYAEHISSSFSSFDDLLAGVISNVRAMGEHLRTGLSAEVIDAPFDLMIAGWSESRDRGEVYGLFNHETYGLPAWSLVPIEEGCLTPGDQGFTDRLREAGIDPRSEAFDPAADGLRILEEQRAMPWPALGGGEPIYGVGGFGQLTTLERDRITTRILKRWPDAIGEKITAAGAAKAA